MRKVLAAGMAALTLGTAMAATALPAEAQTRYRSYSRGHSGGDVAGAAIVAGIAGLALGSALSSHNNSRGYYSNGYYSNGYYGDSYYGRGYAPSYGYGYYQPGYDGYYGRSRVCESRRWVFDEYTGRRVLVRSTYRC